MSRWAEAAVSREQLLLIPESLDESIPADHTVRMLDELLGQLNWSVWESCYHSRLGQPAIHPRVVAGVLLYGLLVRIRSSRSLEDALRVRLDFRWLASSRTIDHTTLSEFRRKHKPELKDLFIRICELAREMGLLNLQRLGFDGTRVRANNRRSGTRTREELQKERDELAAKFDALVQQAEVEDAEDQELFGSDSSHALPEELRDKAQRLAKLNAVLQALDRNAAEGGKEPARVPITDFESRVMPNKDGGFAPNYTPLATVDIDSGLIVGADVLNVINEDGQLMASIEEARTTFLPQTESPAEQAPLIVLTDGLNGTGANLAACETAQINLISPCDLPDPSNPALRPDPTQPVPESEWDRLPTTTTTRNGQTQSQLNKSAFVYDAEKDCYWCPQGQLLENSGTTSEKSGSGRRIRTRYQAPAAVCAGCPLRGRCVQGKAKSRQINREQYEQHRERHAAKMATQEAKDLYKLRRHSGERPFAVIKHQFGLRQFLLRGLEKVQTEWRWAATAFNLDRIISLLRNRAGPPRPRPS
jgi:transposase